MLVKPEMQNETHGATNEGVGGADSFWMLQRDLSFAASNGYCHLLTYNFIAQISLRSPLQSPNTSLSTLLLVL